MTARDTFRTCRGCGCTDDHACPGGCSWVLLDIDQESGICGTCAEELEWDPVLMINTGLDDGFPDSPFAPSAVLRP